MLSHIDVEMLFGPGICADDFNEYVMGETLDAVAAFGEDTLFFHIMKHVRTQIDIPLSRLHADTTNFSVQGAYNASGDEATELHLTYGHAKDKRTDLKRWALRLITNAQGIPLAIKALNGNDSDHITILEGIKSLKAALESEHVEEPGVFVADSAFYTSTNIAKCTGKWLSHAPDKLKEVRACLLKDDVAWSPRNEHGYQWYGFDITYAMVPQRWILVYSQAMYERQYQTLLKSQEKELKEAAAATYHLKAQQFRCEADARVAVAKLVAQFPLVHTSEPELITTSVSKDGTRGRPKAESTMQVFSISIKCEKSQAAVDCASRTLGRFVLATNDRSLSDEQILTYYKEQQCVERGFRFLKDGRLRLTPIFLKNPARVRALSFIMCLTLLVYVLIENKMRDALAKEKQTIHIQNAGPAAYRDNARPTLTKVFMLFRGLSTIVVTTITGEKIVTRSALPTEVKKVLALLGPMYEQAFTQRR